MALLPIFKFRCFSDRAIEKPQKVSREAKDLLYGQYGYNERYRHLFLKELGSPFQRKKKKD